MIPLSDDEVRALLEPHEQDLWDHAEEVDDRIVGVMRALAEARAALTTRAIASDLGVEAERVQVDHEDKTVCVLPGVVGHGDSAPAARRKTTDDLVREMSATVISVIDDLARSPKALRIEHHGPERTIVRMRDGSGVLVTSVIEEEDPWDRIPGRQPRLRWRVTTEPACFEPITQAELREADIEAIRRPIDDD